MPDPVSSSVSRFWRLFALESRAQARRLALFLAAATPLLLLWLLSESAILSFRFDFFTRQFFVLLCAAGLLQVHYSFGAARSAFESAQYLTLPVSAAAKYAVRLLWVLLLTPLLTAAYFALWAPVSQQLSLWLVQAQQLTGFEPSWGNVLLAYALLMALVIPGALLFRSFGVVKTIVLYVALFLLLSLLISLTSVQPAVVSRFNNIGAGLDWFIRLHPAAFRLIALGGVLPLFLLSGYFLFRDKQLA